MINWKLTFHKMFFMHDWEDINRVKTDGGDTDMICRWNLPWSIPFAVNPVAP